MCWPGCSRQPVNDVKVLKAVFCFTLLRCALAAAQCIVFGPVCLWVCVSVTMITQNHAYAR